MAYAAKNVPVPVAMVDVAPSPRPNGIRIWPMSTPLQVKQNFTYITNFNAEVQKIKYY